MRDFKHRYKVTRLVFAYTCYFPLCVFGLSGGIGNDPKWRISISDGKALLWVFFVRSACYPVALLVLEPEGLG